MRKRTSVLLAVGFSVLFTAWVSPGAEEAATVNAPQTITLDSLAKLYGPVEFDHSMHTEIAGSCSDCHHTQKDLKQGGKAMPCKTCHKSFDPDQKDKPGLKGAYHGACLTCHEVEWRSDPAGCSGACHKKK